eukprot:CAMPEP_0194347488 /NCGR_PEP_ID=MMETSP0171-20130528/106017_1 /TAXON_ID=218684 /ORGANISM="Corethron pennatum, Strain L29A3" /LENGTH=50 /DNA_ID=CAMNT_0039114745 /DNA_START=913 /DNA_END=1065 /DNA_ORIENTATION=-
MEDDAGGDGKEDGDGDSNGYGSAQRDVSAPPAVYPPSLVAHAAVAAADPM